MPESGPDSLSAASAPRHDAPGHDTPAHDTPVDGVQQASRRPRIWRYLILAALVFGALAAYGIYDRSQNDEALSQWTNKRAIPSVDLVTPKHATEDSHFALPADVEAFYTAPIHSRVNGYVKMWYFDIGAHVKAGAILARIDTPDLDQQYEQAKGELAKTQADYNLALLTAERWKSLRASQAVSQQTADEKIGDAQARKAEVFAEQANLDRVKAMENFKDIVAPFDGVITARRIDLGALVSATSTDQKSLFDVSSIEQMRVYVRVPQIDAAGMHKGLPMTLTLPQYPGRRFVGAIETTSNAISDTARALLVEAIFPNPDGLLTPGAYAEARFNLPLDPHKLVVPASTMIFRNQTPEVATVVDGKVTLKSIQILVDLGTEIEISTGLEPGEKVVVSPSDSIENGDEVKVAKINGVAVDAKVSSSSYPGSRAEHEAKK